MSIIIEPAESVIWTFEQFTVIEDCPYQRDHMKLLKMSTREKQ